MPRKPRTSARTFVGISGWNYPPWRGVFYPDGLRHADELAFAAERFDAIEINGSFYSLKRPEHYRAWHDATPPGFVFAVKGSRYVTHMLKLRNCTTALANFFASGVLALGAKLGPILWQLPPQLPFDRARLEAFFALLPRTTDEAARLGRKHDARVRGRAMTHALTAAPIRHAIEVRHASFLDPEFVRVLRRHRIACCVADTAGVHPSIEDVTADFVYVRLHGGETLYVSGYDAPAIARWGARVRAWQSGGQPSDALLAAPRRPPAPRSARNVYVFFDNDVKVRAPFDAIALRANLVGDAGREVAAEQLSRLATAREETRTAWPAWRARA
jgi:uncharacterized protein YecE (DUF72 family)